MKISVHTDVLVELAEVVHDEGPEAGKAWLDHLESEFWTPALLIAGAHKTLASKYGTAIAGECLLFIQENIGCVPLQKVSLSMGIEHGNLSAAGHISANSLIGIDAVLTRSLDSQDVNGLRCINPEELESELDRQAPPTHVPFLDLKAQFSKIYNEIDDRFTDIISHTGFILGPHVQEFEEAFAELQRSKYCVGVSSGTDALHLACLALGIGHGDKVIVPVNTFIATAAGVSLAGATPIFVDSNEYYNIDVDKARATLEELGSDGGVRAIVPVHLYGQPADIDGILTLAQDFDLAIIEDCAQAHLAEYKGRKVGNDGQLGTFSYYPGKNLGAFGEAGSIVVNDEKLYERVKMIRAHGEATRYKHSLIGHNYRMEALQGAVLATKAKYILEWTASRQRNAQLYCELLQDIEEIQLPAEPEFSKAVYHLFVIQVDNRDKLREYLERQGIATGLHYPIPLHLQQAYADLGYVEGDFPVAERQAKKIVSLPMYPELSERDIRYVCDNIRIFFAARNGSKS